LLLHDRATTAGALKNLARQGRRGGRDVQSRAISAAAPGIETAAQVEGKSSDEPCIGVLDEAQSQALLCDALEIRGEPEFDPVLLKRVERNAARSVCETVSQPRSELPNGQFLIGQRYRNLFRNVPAPLSEKWIRSIVMQKAYRRPHIETEPVGEFTSVIQRGDETSIGKRG
jgi:hypothetical protein